MARSTVDGDRRDHTLIMTMYGGFVLDAKSRPSDPTPNDRCLELCMVRRHGVG